MVACGLDFPKDQVVVGEWLYFTEESRVGRTALTGDCGVEVLWEVAGAIPFGIAASDDAVYWTVPMAGRVFEYELRSGKVSLLSEAEDGALGIDGSGSTVVWVNSDSGVLRRFDPTTRSIQDVASGLTMATAVVLNGEREVIVSATSTTPLSLRVAWVDLQSGGIRTLASGFPHNTNGALALDRATGQVAFTASRSLPITVGCAMPYKLRCWDGTVGVVGLDGAGLRILSQLEQPVTGVTWLGGAVVYAAYAELRRNAGGSESLLLEDVAGGLALQPLGESSFLVLDPQLYTDVIRPNGRVLQYGP